MLILIAGEQ